MDEEKSKLRMDELGKILDDANYNYYVLDNPTITDQEFDQLLRELEILEEKYPKFALKDSPTKRVGGLVIDKFKKITHTIPMLSLPDVFSYDEIIAFDERIRKKADENGIEDIKYVVETKIDGLSAALEYKNGNKELYLFNNSTKEISKLDTEQE